MITKEFFEESRLRENEPKCCEENIGIGLDDAWQQRHSNVFSHLMKMLEQVLLFVFSSYLNASDSKEVIQNKLYPSMTTTNAKSTRMKNITRNAIEQPSIRRVGISVLGFHS